MADAVVHCDTGALTGGATGTVTRGISVTPDPDGAGGGFPYTDVLALVADPAAVTDWGTVLNASIAAGNKRHVIRRAAGLLPFTTPINADDVAGVIFEGETGLHWVQDDWAGTEVPQGLLYKGTGSGSSIHALGSSGFTLRDLGIYYDNAGFTGKQVDLGGISASSEVSRCHIGSLDNALTTADCNVSFENAILASLVGCALFGAQYNVRGTNIPHSNANSIRGRCVFTNAAVAHLWGIWDGWTIDDNVFEVQNTPAVIDGPTGTSYTSAFSFTNNWVGDVSGSNRPLFRQRVDNYWNAEFSNNQIRSPGGPLFELLAGGNIQIVNNPVLQSNEPTDPIIDLGDTSAGAVAKASVWITGNQWVCTGADAVIHRAGHKNVHIYGNENGAGVLEQRSFGGHEHLAYQDRRSLPTVVKGAAAPNATVSITGTDKAGILSITTGDFASAGEMAVVTFGKPYTATPGSPQSRVAVQLTPCLQNGFDNKNPKVSASSLTGFSVSVSSAPGNVNASFFYEVVGM